MDTVKPRARNVVWAMFRFSGSIAFGFLSTWLRSFFLIPERATEEFRELAIKYYEQGLPNLSILCLERAVAQAPSKTSKASLYSDLGQLYYERGEFEKARERFETALNLDYDNKEALRGLGTALQSLELPEEAIYYYLTYLSHEPEDVSVLLNLGIILDDLGRLEEAIEYFQKAKEKDPRNLLIHESLGRALYGLGRFDEAAQELEQALHLDPRDSEVHRLLGLTWEALGDLDKATGCYREAIARNPENGYARLNLASLENWRKGDAEEVIEHLQSALTLFRANKDTSPLPNALWDLGWAYYRLGRWKDSVDASREALKLDGNLVPVRFNLALALLRQGDLEEARREYSEGLQRVSEVWDLRNGISDLEEAKTQDPALAGADAILEMLRAKDCAFSAGLRGALKEPEG